jgi:phenylacetate-CoA ligase
MEYKYYVNHMLKRSLFYHYYKKILERTKGYSVEELNTYKERRLQKVVQYSYRNVPYYKMLFDRLRINPEEIKTLNDLKKLPIMDKKTIKDNFKDLTSKKCIRKLCKVETTSGTTGIPSKILRDVHCVNFEQAALARFWNNVGDDNLKRVVLRGNEVVPSSQKEPPFWIFNPADNELIVSSYHLAECNPDIILEKMGNFNPKVLYAYPSTAYLLAKKVDERKYKGLDLRYIFTSSEMLIENQRDYIEKKLNCKIFDWYGQSERVSAISQCEKGAYHIVEDYSITELIDTEYGKEIVGTSLYNYAMPLLRYRTGDIVVESNKICNCKCNFRKIELINGRKVSYIISKKGKHIPGNLLGTFLGKVSGIDEFQIIQEKAGEIIIDIVKGKEFKNESVEFIKSDTNRRIGVEFEISVNFKDKIPVGANFKKSPFINKLLRNN